MQSAKMSFFYLYLIVLLLLMFSPSFLRLKPPLRCESDTPATHHEPQIVWFRF
jgi:hypothetical protein